MARKGLKLNKSPGLGPCAEWRTQQPSSGCVRPRGLWLKPLAKRLEIIGGCLRRTLLPIAHTSPSSPPVATAGPGPPAWPNGRERPVHDRRPHTRCWAAACAHFVRSRSVWSDTNQTHACVVQARFFPCRRHSQRLASDYGCRCRAIGGRAEARRPSIVRHRRFGPLPIHPAPPVGDLQAPGRLASSDGLITCSASPVAQRLVS